MSIGVKVTYVKSKAVDFQGMQPVIMVTKIEGTIETEAVNEPMEEGDVEGILINALSAPYLEISFKEKPVLYHEAEAALEQLALRMLGLEGK
jgi:hypothetical protein